MHHIYFYEVEKSVLISRLFKVMKNKKRSPFMLFTKKGFKRGRAIEYSTKKPLQKTYTREKFGGGA